MNCLHTPYFLSKEEDTGLCNDIDIKTNSFDQLFGNGNDNNDILWDNPEWQKKFYLSLPMGSNNVVDFFCSVSEYHQQHLLNTYDEFSNSNKNYNQIKNISIKESPCISLKTENNSISFNSFQEGIASAFRFLDEKNENNNHMIVFQNEQKKHKKKKLYSISNMMCLLDFNGCTFLWIMMYLLLNMFVLLWKSYRICENNSFWIETGGSLVCLTKGFGQVIALNSLLILLPLLRSVKRLFFCIPLIWKYVHINDGKTIHIVIGMMIFFFGVLHSIGHILIFLKISQLNKITWITTPELNNGDVLGGYNASLFDYFLTLPGWTGMSMLLLLIIALICWIPSIRNKHWSIFEYTHKLFFPCWIICYILHGMKGWIQTPTAYLWILIPLLVYLIERRRRYFPFFVTIKSAILSYNSLHDQGDLLELKIQKPSYGWKGKPGMYLLLNLPSISWIEWHPFTITSSSNSKEICLHIRKSGDWTEKLHCLIMKCKSQSIPYPTIRIDGPIGTSSQLYQQYQVVVFAAAGVGITPFLSILNNVIEQYKQHPNKFIIRQQIIHLHWVVRKPQDLISFVNYFNTISYYGLEKQIQIFPYVTGFNTKKKKWIKSLQLVQNVVSILYDFDIISHMSKCHLTQFSRPNWHCVFRNYCHQYSCSRVGVFICASLSMEFEIKNICHQYNKQMKKKDPTPSLDAKDKKKLKFICHSERF